ncbi:hypothetical protein OIU77_006322 [Salix suchowensis]|uniref:Uncharacterized protein n=1 Tax=Salix suchowensis TaxID=1278906 RepID=A0ABQ9ALU0_9ROSI|nr:hypothetical protein OIU77_006322 [Salix suchowensis]
MASTRRDKLSEELHLASLELLRRFGNGFRRLKSGRIVEPTYDAPPYTAVESRGFPPEEIMGIAGAKFIQSASLSVDVSSMFDNPFYLLWLIFPTRMRKWWNSLNSSWLLRRK